MDAVRLSYEYAASCERSHSSRRVDRDELDRRGQRETVFLVPANTLVVANTCGYHRRTRGNPGETRTGVHMSHRRNPFLPRALDRLFYDSGWVKRLGSIVAGVAS